MAQDTPKKRKRIPTATIVRFGAIAVAMCSVLAGAIYASQRFEQFLIRDPRFFLAGPAEYGLESANIQLKGVQYASSTRILRSFDADFGRSVYLIPLAARRQALLNVGWVHDATVVRVWPNHLIVSVQERKPVAFVKLPAEGMTRWGLIDDDGVILDPPQKAPFHLPVLSGVPAGEPAGQRAWRVQRMQQLLKDLGNRRRHRLRSGRDRSGQFEDHRARARPRRDAAAGRPQLRLAAREFSGTLSGHPSQDAAGRDLRSAPG